MDASSNRAYATCPTVATGEARPLLLEHHSSDGTTATDHFSVAIEGYRPLVQRCIVIVYHYTLFIAFTLVLLYSCLIFPTLVEYIPTLVVPRSTLKCCSKDGKVDYFEFF
jgi:hypothetical protein